MKKLSIIAAIAATCLTTSAMAESNCTALKAAAAENAMLAYSSKIAAENYQMKCDVVSKWNLLILINDIGTAREVFFLVPNTDKAALDAGYTAEHWDKVWAR